MTKKCKNVRKYFLAFQAAPENDSAPENDHVYSINCNQFHFNSEAVFSDLVHTSSEVRPTELTSE